MADYNVQVDWAGKDGLDDSLQAKIISGGDFNTEFQEISTRINERASLNGDLSESFSCNLLTATTVDINGGAIDGATLGTNSAITDARVDNLKLDGNTVSSTDVNGDINLAPNGTGNVVCSSKITNVTDPTADQDAATKAYADDSQEVLQRLVFIPTSYPQQSITDQNNWVWGTALSRQFTPIASDSVIKVSWNLQIETGNGNYFGYYVQGGYNTTGTGAFDTILFDRGDKCFEQRISPQEFSCWLNSWGTTAKYIGLQFKAYDANFRALVHSDFVQPYMVIEEYKNAKTTVQTS